MTVKAYLLSLPERFVRSVLGLGAGLAREVGEVAIPDGVRQGRLYQSLVDTTLRFLIEQVGGAEGVYKDDEKLPDNFLVRRTAGNAVEMLGVVAFRASPVWVLAALADVCGMGRQLIPEISDALKTQGLLEKDAQFTSVDQLLDGLERTSSRLADTINTPPLDVAGLRKEWEAIRADARNLQAAGFPPRETIDHLWSQLKTESARQERSIFETSSMMALSAVRAVPDSVRWLSASARVGATRTGYVFGAALLVTIERRSARSGRSAIRRMPAGSCDRTSARPQVSSRRVAAPSPNACSSAVGAAHPECPWGRGGWCRNLADARLPRRMPRLSSRPSKSEAGVRAPTPRRGHSAANQDGAIAAMTFPRN